MNKIDPNLTPITRVELKRVGVADLVRGDSELSSSELVRALSAEAAQRLFQMGVARRFRSGGRVFKEGEAGDTLLWVLKGQVRLQRGDPDPVEVSVIPKGGVLGESEIIDKKGIRRFSAVADGDLDVLEIPRKGLVDIARQSPALVNLLRRLEAERQKTFDEMASFLKRW